LLEFFEQNRVSYLGRPQKRKAGRVLLQPKKCVCEREEENYFFFAVFFAGFLAAFFVAAIINSPPFFPLSR